MDFIVNIFIIITALSILASIFSLFKIYRKQTRPKNIDICNLRSKNIKVSSNAFGKLLNDYISIILLTNHSEPIDETKIKDRFKQHISSEENISFIKNLYNHSSIDSIFNIKE